MIDRPPEPTRKLSLAGIILTVLYLGGMFLYALASRSALLDMKPDEFATFLAGVFGPLAFLWLVLGFFQQGAELRHSADALWLQGQELQNSVEQQRNLVEVTREQNYFLPGDLEAHIEAFVEHYNHQRYHESLANVTPADAYFGRAPAIIKLRERIKRQTIEHRRLQHRKFAA